MEIKSGLVWTANILLIVLCLVWYDWQLLIILLLLDFALLNSGSDDMTDEIDDIKERLDCVENNGEEPYDI